MTDDPTGEEGLRARIVEDIRPWGKSKRFIRIYRLKKQI